MIRVHWIEALARERTVLSETGEQFSTTTNFISLTDLHPTLAIGAEKANQAHDFSAIQGKFRKHGEHNSESRIH